MNKCFMPLATSTAPRKFYSLLLLPKQVAQRPGCHTRWSILTHTEMFALALLNALKSFLISLLLPTRSILTTRPDSLSWGLKSLWWYKIRTFAWLWLSWASVSLTLGSLVITIYCLICLGKAPLEFVTLLEFLQNSWLPVCLTLASQLEGLLLLFLNPMPLSRRLKAKWFGWTKLLTPPVFPQFLQMNQSF